MALTKDFKETIQARARRDPAFRIALLREAFECLLAGDVDPGKLMLRNYINATQGFGALGERMHKSSKSLMRMLSPSGNATTENVFQILFQLQRAERIRFKLKASPATGSFMAQKRKANRRNEQRRAAIRKP